MQETADAFTMLEGFCYHCQQRLLLCIFHEQHARCRTVMAVASPWGAPMLGHTHNVLQMADHGFDSLPGDASRAQDDWWGTGHIEHRRFEPNTARPCIQDEGDAATKIVEDMLGGGRTR